MFVFALLLPLAPSWGKMEIFTQIHVCLLSLILLEQTQKHSSCPFLFVRLWQVHALMFALLSMKTINQA